MPLKNKLFPLGVLLLIASNCFSQSSSFGITGGLSKVLGDGSEYWKYGYNFGVQLFYSPSENFLIGGGINYSQWNADKAELTKYYKRLGFDGTVTSMTYIFEIVPSIRILIPIQKANFSFLGHFGFGLFYLNEELRFKGPYSEFITRSSERDPGLNMGGGISIWKFELLTLYHYVFTKSGSSSYLTVNTGFNF